MTSPKMYAAWTAEQVAALSVRQADDTMHPYTCGNDSNHSVLVPSESGWTCPDCGYQQDWYIGLTVNDPTTTR